VFETLYCSEHDHYLDDDGKYNLYAKLFKKKLAGIVLESLPSDNERWDKYTVDLEKELMGTVVKILEEANIVLANESYSCKPFSRNAIQAVTTGLKSKFSSKLLGEFESATPNDNAGCTNGTEEALFSLIERMIENDDAKPPTKPHPRLPNDGLEEDNATTIMEDVTPHVLPTSVANLPIF